MSDAKLWETLDMCHLKEVVTMAGGLGAKVLEGGESLSLGQRQLLCLARSLLGTARVSATKNIYGIIVIFVYTY
jgi:ATP-binding cassette subfamily C (CFTR/MRP) protein 10